MAGAQRSRLRAAAADARRARARRRADRDRRARAGGRARRRRRRAADSAWTSAQRSERVAFADGLDLLCAWGVLEHTSGSHESYARREQGDDEALFTVDRRRLALLLRDPAIGARGDHASSSSSTRPRATHQPGGGEPCPGGAARTAADRGPFAAAGRPRRRRARLLPRSAGADRERRRTQPGIKSSGAPRAAR